MVLRNRIYLPSSGPNAWRQLLAKPDLQWVTGYSARTLAYCWQAADGLPAEIAALLEPALGPAELLLAIPEHKTALPGGRRESQSDVFALVRTAAGLVAIAIEGKVDEPFGPTIAEWLVDASPGKLERLDAIKELLGLSEEIDGAVRYQLLHRTAAAVLEAEHFSASSAAMIVHSFSPERRWHADYKRFAQLLGCVGDVDRAERAVTSTPCPFYIGWAGGDQRFLSA